MSTNSAEQSSGRRRVLRSIAGVVAGLVLAFFGLDSFFPRWRKWIAFGPRNPYQPVTAMESLPAGQWKLLSFDVIEQGGDKKIRSKRSVWVRRGNQPEAISVLSPVCPHNGCQINWRPEKSAFVCPCHGGTFDADGKLKSGPPKRSMDPLDFRVEAGQLLVRWEASGS
jgi:Rieske Fe-S protein